VGCAQIAGAWVPPCKDKQYTGKEKDERKSEKGERNKPCPEDKLPNYMRSLTKVVGQDVFVLACCFSTISDAFSYSLYTNIQPNAFDNPWLAAFDLRIPRRLDSPAPERYPAVCARQRSP
jgi:hypothetical protein